MSKGNFQRRVSKVLLEEFNRKSEKDVADAARILLQSSKVQQCLVADPESLMIIQRGFEAGIGRTLKGKQGPSYRKALYNYIRGISKPFPNSGSMIDKFFLKLVKQNGLVFGQTIFYVPVSFDSVKDKINESFNEPYFVDKLQEEGQADYDRKKFGNTVNLDHGADGTASGLMGSVIGALTVKKKSTRKLPKDFNKVFSNNLTAALDRKFKDLTKGQKGKIKRGIMKLVSVNEQILSTGGDLRAGISMILTPVFREDNIRAGSDEEKKTQQAFLEAFETTFAGIDYGNLKGSSTLNQKVEQFIVRESLVKQLKKKGLKITLRTTAPNVKLKTKTNSTDKSKAGKGKQVKSARRGGRFAVAPTAGRQQASSSAKRSMFSIMAMINEKLPRVVEKNMRSPRLESRSGTFARSARLTDVNMTPKGFPSFGYTYDKNPYEVFEVGRGVSPWASPDRDPRKLIDASIREIAGTMALGRFFTRRV